MWLVIDRFAGDVEGSFNSQFRKSSRFSREEIGPNVCQEADFSNKFLDKHTFLKTRFNLSQKASRKFNFSSLRFRDSWRTYMSRSKRRPRRRCSERSWRSWPTQSEELAPKQKRRRLVKREKLCISCVRVYVKVWVAMGENLKQIKLINELPAA